MINLLILSVTVNVTLLLLLAIRVHYAKELKKLLDQSIEGLEDVNNKWKETIDGWQQTLDLLKIKESAEDMPHKNVSPYFKKRV